MTTPGTTTVPIPPGAVVMTTYGYITQQTTQCLLNAQRECERAGATNIAWAMEPGALVDRARNAAARNALAAGAQWLLYIDGDTTFEPNSILRMLHAAFVETPHADVLGGYVALRGDLALPTIDTGTGTWESWFPNSGTVEVIRTGAAFLLVKKHVFDALQQPWFCTRVPARPLDFMHEVDNFARIKFNGENPLRAGDAWAKLEKCARDEPSVAPEQWTPGEVGEDSNFCDRVRAAGLRIYVNTDIACGHVDHRTLTSADHRRALDERDRTQRLLCGVTA